MYAHMQMYNEPRCADVYTDVHTQIYTCAYAHVYTHVCTHVQVYDEHYALTLDTVMAAAALRDHEIVLQPATSAVLEYASATCEE